MKGNVIAMKKFFAVLTALCIVVLCFSSCGKKIGGEVPEGSEPVTGDSSSTVPTDGGDETPGEQTAPTGETWNGYDIGFVKDNGLEYIWNQLEDDIKEDVAVVMNAIKNVELMCELPNGIPAEDSNMFCHFIYTMCIDYTYMGNSFNFKDTDGDGKKESLVLPYNFDAVVTEADAWNYTSQLNAKLDEIIAGIPDGTEYERVKYLHDYLVLNTTYGETAKLPFTAYGALVEQTATCQGYADAMHLLLTRAGFEAAFAVGHGDSLELTHKWNYVRLSDGKWYILDPTWADPTGRDDPNFINYDYFLISDEVLMQDHAEKFDNDYYGGKYYFDIPVAESMDLSYHMVMGYYAETYEQAYEIVEKQALECAQNGGRYVYLRVSDEDLYTDVYHRLLLTDYGAEIQDIIRDVNEQAGSNFGSWRQYRGHKDGKGPFTFIITLVTKDEQ